MRSQPSATPAWPSGQRMSAGRLFYSTGNRLGPVLEENSESAALSRLRSVRVGDCPRLDGDASLARRRDCRTVCDSSVARCPTAARPSWQSGGQTGRLLMRSVRTFLEAAWQALKEDQ
jgi:hypothetical protein